MIYKIYAIHEGRKYDGELDESRIIREKVIDGNGGMLGYGYCVRGLRPKSTGWMTPTGAGKEITNHSVVSVDGWRRFWKFAEAGPNWEVNEPIQKILSYIRGE